MGSYTITGGAGFIGSHLADALLADGHAVQILDDFSTGHAANLDPRCSVIVGDVTDPNSVRQALAGADGCFHLAAIASVVRSTEAWLETHRVNQAGTVTVLEAARDLGGLPVVYASSAAVYGNVGDQMAHEKLPPQPLTAYGVDKFGSELHARVGWQVHQVPTLGLRFFNVYGPRQDPSSPYSGVISIFARRLADGLAVEVHGTGEQTRDFIYVGDVVAHLAAGMRLLRREGRAAVLNVCTGRGTSIRELVQILGDLQGRQPVVNAGPARVGDIRHAVGDPAAAAALLGVRAAVALPDGLAATLAYLRGTAPSTAARQVAVAR